MSACNGCNDPYCEDCAIRKMLYPFSQTRMNLYLCTFNGWQRHLPGWQRHLPFSRVVREVSKEKATQAFIDFMLVVCSDLPHRSVMDDTLVETCILGLPGPPGVLSIHGEVSLTSQQLQCEHKNRYVSAPKRCRDCKKDHLP